MKANRKPAARSPVRKAAPARKAASLPSAAPNGAVIGAKLRTEREKQGIAVREMARRVSLSPSLISQIERGLVTPSVATLWSMANELGLTMDELFKSTERTPPSPARGKAAPAHRTNDPVQRSHNRQSIRLAGGVQWERLTAQPDDEVEFLHVRYEVGSESCPEDSFFQHGGKEYAYILQGRLGLQISFDRYELSPGDSVSFDSHQPHRLWTIGREPVVAIWVIIKRTNDPRKEQPTSLPEGPR